MTDEADRATQIVIDAEERTLALRLARLRLMPGGSPACTVCGADIPEARRAAITGCCTCVDCQQDLERGMGR